MKIKIKNIIYILLFAHFNSVRPFFFFVLNTDRLNEINQIARKAHAERKQKNLAAKLEKEKRKAEEHARIEQQKIVANTSIASNKRNRRMRNKIC